MSNPLLQAGLPAYDRIEPEHAVPAIESCIADCQAALTDIKAASSSLDATTLVTAESVADQRLSQAWSTISHLHAVCNSPAWREAHQACLAKIMAYATDRGQDRELLACYQQAAAREDFVDQSAAVQRAVTLAIQDFQRSGVDLEGSAREAFKADQLRLSELSTQFGHHVLDASEAYVERFDDAAALAGLPDDALAQLAQLAEQAEESGWRANLSFPAFRAIITYADDRDLRARFYRAWNSRASDRGPLAGQHDNGAIVDEILTLRQRQAGRLGFAHHADYQLARRMADSVEDIEAFLHDLVARAKPLAQAQLAELQAYADQLGGPNPLQPWDVAYYSEKLRDAQLGVSDEQLKPWFEVGRVIHGVFAVAESLFNVRFVADETVSTWHSSVQFFHVLDGDGEAFAGLYVDLYARSGKQGGAWMSVCRARMALGEHQQAPVANLTCNFAPPTEGRPSLLTHNDVVTLFHEFGHCLHHLLTQVEVPSVAGIDGVEWDAVELPSQLLEGWAWAKPSLDRFALHVEDKQPLPESLCTGLVANRQFQGAMMLLRQIQFALTDLSLHSRPEVDVLAVMNEIHEQVALMPMTEDNRFVMSFSHLFNGGYSAGYYSYLWAERLARDAFSVFDAEGLFDAELGQRLADEILSVGASRPMAESWQAFRGREAALEPLLAAYGVAA